MAVVSNDPQGFFSEGAIKRKEGSKYVEGVLGNSSVRTTMSTIVMPNGQEVEQTDTVDASGARISQYMANGAVIITQSANGGKVTIVKRQDELGQFKTTSLSIDAYGNSVVSSNGMVSGDNSMFYKEMALTQKIIAGQVKNPALTPNIAQPAPVQEGSTQARSSVIPTTHIATVGNTTSIGLEGVPPDIYSGGQKVQQPISGRIARTEMLSGSEAMNHPALKNLPDKARQDALRYAAAGGMFIVDHVAPAGESTGQAPTGKKAGKAL